MLNGLLIIGIGVLAWRKLSAWTGFPRALGIGVALAYIAWALWEAPVSLRDSRSHSVNLDRWTLEIYALSQGGTVFSALLLDTHWPIAAKVCPTAGTILFASGAFLRIWAVHELGDFYSHRVQILDAHKIVRTGPYRWLRHPAYTGMLMAHFGLVFLFFNWVSLVVLLGALVPSLVLRILVEERTLQRLLGYNEFCRGRARVIPMVW